MKTAILLNLMTTKLRLIILLTHSLDANSFELQFLYEVKSHNFFKKSTTFDFIEKLPHEQNIESQ